MSHQEVDLIIAMLKDTIHSGDIHGIVASNSSLTNFCSLKGIKNNKISISWTFPLSKLTKMFFTYPGRKP